MSMTAEKKQDIKEWALWGTRSITIVVLTVLANHTSDLVSSVGSMQSELLLYKYQIESLQAENSMLKLDIRELEKETSSDRTAVWKYLAELKQLK